MASVMVPELRSSSSEARALRTMRRRHRLLDRDCFNTAGGRVRKNRASAPEDRDSSGVQCPQTTAGASRQAAGQDLEAASPRLTLLANAASVAAAASRVPP